MATRIDSEKVSYRQSFGLENPPPGTEVKIEHMPGLNWYVLWPGCGEDGEDVLAAWMNKKEAIAFCEKNNYKWQQE